MGSAKVADMLILMIVCGPEQQVNRDKGKWGCGMAGEFVGYRPVIRSTGRWPNIVAWRLEVNRNGGFCPSPCSSPPTRLGSEAEEEIDLRGEGVLGCHCR